MATRILRAASLLGLLAAASPAWAEEYRVQVNGLSCPFCAYGIEKKLGQIKGVEKVETDIAAGSVTVTTAEGAILDRATVAQAVKDAGFGLGGFEQLDKAAKAR